MTEPSKREREIATKTFTQFNHDECYLMCTDELSMGEYEFAKALADYRMELAKVAKKQYAIGDHYHSYMRAGRVIAKAIENYGGENESN